MADRNYISKAITSSCLACEKSFTYMHRTGARKRHCDDVCRQKWHVKRAAARKPNYPPCKIDGCHNTAERVGAGLCEKHFGRARRGAPVDRAPPAYRYTRRGGYIVLLRPDHPLAGKGGAVGEHRLVAYRANEGICPHCFWCGCELNWARAVIDHLDEQKAHNSPSNLVVSCNDCNRARGAMLPFVAGLTDAALPVFIERLIQYRAARTEKSGTT